MSYRKEMPGGKVVTYSDFVEKRTPKNVDKICFSSSVAKNRDIHVMIREAIWEKVKTGKQIIILDNLNIYHDGMSRFFEADGYQVLNIDPDNDYANSDSINVMPLLIENPNIRHYASMFIEDLVGKRDAVKAKLAYRYYAEAIEPDPEKQTVSGLFDTILSFSSRTEEELTNSLKVPRTAKLYSEIFYAYASERELTPADAIEHTTEIHKKIVDSVELLLKNDAEASADLIKGIKEVYSGARGTNISLDPGSSDKRVIFLNTTGLMTDKVMNFLFQVFVTTEPSSVVVLDGTLKYDKTAIRIPSFCNSYITAATDFYHNADLVVIENRANRSGEETYMYKLQRKREGLLSPLLKFIWNILILAFRFASILTLMVALFPEARNGVDFVPEVIEFGVLLRKLFTTFFWYGALIAFIAIAIKKLSDAYF